MGIRTVDDANRQVEFLRRVVVRKYILARLSRAARAGDWLVAYLKKTHCGVVCLDGRKSDWVAMAGYLVVGWLFGERSFRDSAREMLSLGVPNKLKRSEKKITYTAELRTNDLPQPMRDLYDAALIRAWVEGQQENGMSEGAGSDEALCLVFGSSTERCSSHRGAQSGVGQPFGASMARCILRHSWCLGVSTVHTLRHSVAWYPSELQDTNPNIAGCA